jgi:hypothetical protein
MGEWGRGRQEVAPGRDQCGSSCPEGRFVQVLELPQHQETKRRPGRGISATVLTPVSQTPPAFLQLYAGLSWSPQPDFYI